MQQHTDRVSFDDALRWLQQMLSEGVSYQRMEAWIEDQRLPEDEKAALWFVLEGGEGDEPRRHIIFARDLVGVVG